MHEEDLGLLGANGELMDIGIKHLYYFIVAADEGNVTRAARRLYISQPTLSKYILSLEEKLGIKLFLRGERTLILSRQGRFFYEKWRELLQELRTGYEQGKRMGAAWTEPLRVGCFPVLNMHRFLRVCTDALSECCPGATTELESGSYVELLDKLNGRQLDVIFLPAADLPDKREDMECRIIGRAAMAAVVSAEMDQLRGDRIHMEQLRGQTILFAEPAGRYSRRREHTELLSHLGIRGEQLRFVNSYQTAYTEAEQGRGIALGIRAVFPTHNERVRILEVEDYAPRIAAVWSSSAPEELKELLRALPSEQKL